jgi:hypothetical protein
LADRPIVIGVATYGSKDAAVADLRAVSGTDRQETLDHISVAVLVKGLDGKLHLEHHETTVDNPAWGGALVGGALAVVATPLAIAPLSDIAVQDKTWAGVGGIVGFFWHNVPKGRLLQMSDLLESGQAALVVVALDQSATQIEALLQGAIKAIVAETDGGDIEHAYQEALAREQRPS